MAQTATQSDVISALPYPDDQIGGSGDKVTGSEIDAWLSEASDLLDAYLLGSSATFDDEAAGLTEAASREYAVWHAKEALGTDPQPHREEWERLTTLIIEAPEDAGDTVADGAQGATNAGDGAVGRFTDGSGGDWRGW